VSLTLPHVVEPPYRACPVSGGPGMWLIPEPYLFYNDQINKSALGIRKSEEYNMRVLLGKEKRLEMADILTF